ncbi:MAG TPA: pyridoxamine 5'-phosphate oxidase family protein [Holophaga sp.]|nr:pyridoxamine 5'-phosphate oxidase family protein [Holophaga sp.]
MDADCIASARALMRRSDVVFVSTLDGHPDTRVLFNLSKLRADAMAAGAAALDAPFASWLGTNSSSRKVGQIRKDPRVCLYYADTTAFEGLSLQGTAVEVFDPAIRTAIWTDAWNVYYPGGREGGDFTLLRFTPERGRYYHGLKVVEFDTADLPA